MQFLRNAPDRAHCAAVEDIEGEPDKAHCEATPFLTEPTVQLLYLTNPTDFTATAVIGDCLPDRAHLYCEAGKVQLADPIVQLLTEGCVPERAHCAAVKRSVCSWQSLLCSC